MDDKIKESEQIPKFLFSLVKGVRNIFILWLISKEKMHGYAIISELNKALPPIMSNKKVHGSTIYPILHKLEDDGLIKSFEDFNGKKKVKVYEITPEGVKLLDLIKEHINEESKDKIKIFIKEMMFNQ